MSIGGLGVGASRIEGVSIGGLGVGGEQLHGLMVAGGTVRVIEGGTLRGVGVSSFNYIQGDAARAPDRDRELRAEPARGAGGVVNIVRNNPKGRRWLPIVNWN
ncbi:MAG: hypothetical protein IPN16_19055 [Gemmatimonadetes bacterium]|nr:hypothetical protein [Gemmatimonadota bacterium]